MKMEKKKQNEYKASKKVVGLFDKSFDQTKFTKFLLEESNKAFEESQKLRRRAWHTFFNETPGASDCKNEYVFESFHGTIKPKSQEEKEKEG